MAYSVKASEFNHQAIARSAARAPGRRIHNGTPVSSAAPARSLDNMLTILLQNGYMPNDNASDYTYSDTAILCLGAISVTVEIIDEDTPAKTFARSTQEPQNNADRRNEMQRKNYSDDTHPGRDDPFYEMDETPPKYVEAFRDNSRRTSADQRSLLSLTAKISDINTVYLPNSSRLKQLAGDR